MSSRTHKSLRVFAVILAAFVAVYVVLTVWSMIALHNAYAALKRDGRPMTLAEVVPPAVPDAANAAPLYEQAFRLLTSAKSDDETLLGALGRAASKTAGTNAAPEAVERLNALLMRPETRQALELVVQAAERKSCRFNLDYASGPGIAMSNLVEGITLTRVVNRDVRRLGAAGDFSNAWHLAIAGVRLAAAKQDEPILLARLGSFACLTIADESMRRLCSVAPLERENRERLLALLARADQPRAFQQMMDGERVVFGEWGFGPRSYQAGASLDDISAWHRFVDSLMWPGFMWRFDHAAYLRFMRNAPSAPLDWDVAKVKVPYYCSITRVILPALDGCRKQFIANLARIRCTEAGLAVLGYRADHGTWPETLAACMPQVPTDPFAAGQPLRYHTTDKGFVVSSLGKTGKPQKEIAWDYVPLTNPPLRHDVAR